VCCSSLKGTRGGTGGPGAGAKLLHNGGVAHYRRHPVALVLKVKVLALDDGVPGLGHAKRAEETPVARPVDALDWLAGQRGQLAQLLGAGVGAVQVHLAVVRGGGEEFARRRRAQAVYLAAAHVVELRQHFESAVHAPLHAPARRNARGGRKGLWRRELEEENAA